MSNDTPFYRMSALGGSVVKSPPAMQETQEMWVRLLGQAGLSFCGSVLIMSLMASNSQETEKAIH